MFLSADIVQGNSSGANPYAYVGGNPETYNDPTGQMFVPPGGGGSLGGVTNGGGSSSPSSIVQPVNAVLPTSTAAQGGSQPCLQIGCVSLLRAKVGFQATVNHFMSVNLPTMVCDPYCFITIGDGQTNGTSTMYGVTEAPVTHCGVSPFVCSDQHAQDGGDTGVNGHDMPDVAPADTGGAEPAGDASQGADEVPTETSVIPVEESGIPVRTDQPPFQMTKTVEGHFAERPYIASSWLVNTIMESDTAVPDSVLPNGLKWEVPGFFNSREGTWQLVVDMDTNTIVHFLFIRLRVS